MWTDDYIGLRFVPNGRDRDGLDCWGLVRLVYKEQMGIELPLCDGALPDTSRESLENARSYVEKESQNWTTVTRPQPMDVILIRLYSDLVSHVGIYLHKNIILHCMAGTESILENIAPKWNKRIAGYRRYEDNR